MEQSQKKEIIANLKEALSKSQGKSQSEYNNLITDISKGKIELLDENDSITFDNNRCLTNCNGRCCLNVGTHILITPIEFDIMYKSEYIQQSKLSRNDFALLFDLYIGESSLIPIGTIKMANFRNLHICPFLHFENFFKYNPSKSNLEINPNGICKLGQKAKPLTCRLFPLGRMNMVKNTSESTNIFFKVEDCPATNTNKTILLKDLLFDYSKMSKIKDEYITKPMPLINNIVKKYGIKKSNTMLMPLISIMYYSNEEYSIKFETMLNFLKELAK